MSTVAVAPVANAGAAAPLTQSDAVASLLSLSFSEGGAALASAPSAVHPKVEPGVQSIPTPSTSVPASSSAGKHHRRLSSTGRTKRRLSDAREAANRPSPSLLQSNAAGLSLAALSLSSSPPSYPAQLSTSFGAASRKLAPAPPNGTSPSPISPLNGRNIPIGSPEGTNAMTRKNSDEETNETGAIPIPTGRSGRKRGVDYKCETCSKIYKHPSCLIKHRWEHTPHWREASKFVLSKHQQVQLLEAAAILSHMSPTVSGGRSLPEDRSLWPSFLSGGSVPTPESALTDKRASSNGDHQTHLISPSNSYSSHPISSSVPARPLSTGPRLHDYGVSPGVVTQVRPGLIGVTTSSGGVAVIGDRYASHNGTPSQPVPVPRGRRGEEGADARGSYRGEDVWGSQSYGYAGGVSLPASSVRSGSSPPRSLSRSRSGSAEANGRHRHSDDSPASDDGVFDQMDGVEDERSGRGIRIVGDKYGSAYHSTSRSYDGYSGRQLGYGHNRLGSYQARRFMKDEDVDDDFAVREEDEEMDDMDGVGRLRKPAPLPKKEEQWDGMEMDMDMD